MRPGRNREAVSSLTRRDTLPVVALAALVALLVAPSAAHALSAPATSTGNYTVTWTESSGGQVRAYLLERFNNGGPTRITVTGTNSRAFSNKPAGNWSYRLEICIWENELGMEVCDPPSPEVTVVVSPVPVPGTPTNLAASPAQSTGSFSLTWGSVTGTVTYTLEERVSPSTTWTAISPNAVSPYSRTRPDGSYSYRVRACSGATCGGYSNVASVTVLAVPGVPGTLGPNLTTGTVYSVSWAASTGTVTRYELRERVGAAAWQVVHSSTGRSKAFFDKDEAVYEYRVRACNGAGCSADTASKFVTVAPPPNITGPAASTGVFTLSWNLPPSPGDIPRLEERVGNGAWHVAFEDRGEDSAAIFKVCQSCGNGQTYQYRLRFCDYEPELPEPVCNEPGAVHRVAVTHPQDDVRASVSACSASQNTAWNAARATQGLSGNDGWGYIGTEVEYKPLPPPPLEVPNWYPADGWKKTLCGRVHRFEVYDGYFAEVDFNHFILPDNDHRYLIDDVFTTSAHDCTPGQNNCIEVEVTPDASFYSNPYFARDGTSALTGRDMCVYGPWVTEATHGDRPEIHPSELLWWRSEETPSGVPTTVYRMVAVQDRSERFDTWAYAPRRAFFRIPFEVGPNDATRVYTISQETPFVRNVVTWRDPAAVWDADNGKTHALVIGARRVLEANETQSYDDDIGARFLDVCEDAGRIRGFLALRTHVGWNMSTNTGFNTIRVETPSVAGTAAAPLAAATAPETPAERGEAIAPVAVRRGMVDGRPGLVMDVELPKSARALASAAIATGSDRQAGVVGAKGPQGGELVRDLPVPLVEGARLQWHAESGETGSAPVTGIGIDARLAAAVPALDRAAVVSWPVVGGAVGATAAPAPPGLTAVSAWEVRLDVEYGARRAGKVTEDDQSVVLEELNEARQERGAKALALFGSEAPIEVRWSFEARDLADGSSVPVATSTKARPGEIEVETASGRLAADTLHVRFPAARPGSVYELAATVATRDANGVTGERVHRVWSAAIAHDDAESLVAASLGVLADQAGLGADELRAKASTSPADVGDPSEPLRRRARVLHQRARRYAMDGALTLDELQTLTLMARRLRQD